MTTNGRLTGRARGRSLDRDEGMPLDLREGIATHSRTVEAEGRSDG